MKRLPASWTPHSITVKPYLGDGANGATYGPPITLSPSQGTGVYVEDVQELVTDTAGREVASSGRVHMSFQDVPLAGSLITVWVGTPFSREAEVVKTARHYHPAWPGYGIAYLR
ncbi:MAG: hypothetical protein BGO96_09765 [Micrococcales bacterium 73-15]|mgnify:CR=1 FL=1|nr:MAG: hypothetical protein BGO96_09765 [Micrococcales bacterium 73-15]